MPPLRIGLFPYLNVQLILRGLERDHAAAVFVDVPSKVAAAFRAGELDAALVPSFEAATLDAALLDTFGIAAEGPVETVILHHRVPLGSIRTLALDEASRTSAALSRLLVFEESGSWPHTQSFSGSSERAPDADAILVIGDPAFHFRREGYTPLDLCEEWRRRFHLPFVFAVLVARPEALARNPAAVLGGALEAGRLEAAAVARSYNSGVDAARAERYMTEVIRYRLGEREREGLALFHRLARERGLLPPT